MYKVYSIDKGYFDKFKIFFFYFSSALKCFVSFFQPIAVFFITENINFCNLTLSFKSP